MTLLFKRRFPQVSVIDMDNHEEVADDRAHGYEKQKHVNVDTPSPQNLAVVDKPASGIDGTTHDSGLDENASEHIMKTDPVLEYLALPPLDHSVVTETEKKSPPVRFSKNRSATSLIAKTGESLTEEVEASLTVEETRSLSIPQIEEPTRDNDLSASNLRSMPRVRPVQLAFRSIYGRETYPERGRPRRRVQVPLERRSHVIVPDSPDACDGFPSYQDHSVVSLSGHGEENQTGWTITRPGHVDYNENQTCPRDVSTVAGNAFYQDRLSEETNNTDRQGD